MKKRCPESFRTNCHWLRCCPKALDDFVDLSGLCQVGRFTYACYYQFLMIFCCFGIFSLDCTVFFITQKYRYRAGRANRSNRPTKSCFTAPGSHLAFVFKNIAHNFYKIKKSRGIAFNKIIQSTTLSRFFWGSVYYVSKYIERHPNKAGCAPPVW